VGEDGYCADQTRYVCGNPVDDALLNIRGVADTLVPQEKSTLAVQRKDAIVGEKSPSLTMSAHVKHYARTPLRALVEERHFALVGGLRFPTWA
jgi:hypothetical protein